MAHAVPRELRVLIARVFAPFLANLFQILNEFRMSHAKQWSDDLADELIVHFDVKDRVDACQPAHARSPYRSHQDGFCLIVERVSGGNLVEPKSSLVRVAHQLTKKRIAQLAGSRFHAHSRSLGLGCGITASDVILQLQFTSQLCHEAFFRI